MILHSIEYKRGISGRGFSDLGQVQGQDQDQGQGQDHLLLQRAALPPFLVLALTRTLAPDPDPAVVHHHHHYYYYYCYY